MRILIALLIFINTSTSSTMENRLPNKSKCSNKCKSNGTIHCVKIVTLEQEQVDYLQMYDCAAVQANCEFEGKAIVSIESMSSCAMKTLPMHRIRHKREDDVSTMAEKKIDDLEGKARISFQRMSSSTRTKKTTPPMNINRVKREDGVSKISEKKTDDLDRWQEFRDECPKECPASTVMLCARCTHGTYHTFLSDCYMRMFLCKHPGEKLELVSRQQCNAVGPVLKDLPRPEVSLKDPQDEDPVLGYIFSRPGNDLSDAPYRRSYKSPSKNGK